MKGGISLSVRKKRRLDETPAVCAQTSPKSHRRYDSLIPSSGVSRRLFTLYEALRETIPIIDTAIYKIIRLTCGFNLSCDDPAIERLLCMEMEKIRVGANGSGLYQFISTYFEQLLTYGTAVGEMVTDGYGELCGLYNAPLSAIELKKTESPFIIRVCSISETGEVIPVRNQELILLSALNPVPDSVWGVSLLRGLPFVSNILAQIFSSIGKNWERFGDLRYAVTYKPANDSIDKAYARERAEAMATEWSKAMDSEEVRDFVAIGDVSVRVIGADNHTLDSEVPVRQIIEEIVAKTGLPPFMLGLSWSTTERMSTQQADIFTTEIEAYRRILTPVINKITEFWLESRGFAQKAVIEWDDVTIQDVLETARADYFEAQSQKIRSELIGTSND